MKARHTRLLLVVLGVIWMLGSPLVSAAQPEIGTVEWCKAREKQLSGLENAADVEKNGKAKAALDKTKDKVKNNFENDAREEYRRYCQ